jgi:hypothetical protein
VGGLDRKGSRGKGGVPREYGGHKSGRRGIGYLMIHDLMTSIMFTICISYLGCARESHVIYRYFKGVDVRCASRQLLCRQVLLECVTSVNNVLYYIYLWITAYKI